jgi:hypothetical protein
MVTLQRPVTQFAQSVKPVTTVQEALKLFAPLTFTPPPEPPLAQLRQLATTVTVTRHRLVFCAVLATTPPLQQTTIVRSVPWDTIVPPLALYLHVVQAITVL